MMLIHFVLVLLISQCNVPSSKCRIAHISKLRSRAMSQQDAPVDQTIFEALLIETLKNFKSFANMATYPLKALITKILPSTLFKRYFEVSASTAKFLCTFCKVVAGYVMLVTRAGMSLQLLEDLLYFICGLISNIIDTVVCYESVRMNFDMLAFIFINNRNLTSLQLCSVTLQQLQCFKDHRPYWDLPIPPKGCISKPNKRDSEQIPLKILHLTDTHTDPLYKIGATSECGKPLCCQMDNPSSVDGAGPWGDYRDCDMPWASLEDTLESITKQHRNESPITYVYFTGDIISHRIWETSIEGNKDEIRRMFKTMKNKLGSIPVFPAVGNHETHPVNVFSPPDIEERFSHQWLFDVLAEEWAAWLPESALSTVRTGGYYSIQVKTGFRIISINSNICVTINWWLLYNHRFLLDHLTWLIEELLKAEQNDETVHILSHIPPGDEGCVIIWAYHYRRIVERFSNTIAAEFNGHTHYDELKTFYNTSNISQMINVAYNGGSFTSFSDVNPNYRIYEIDPMSFKVTDYSDWIYQLPIANFYPDASPRWYELYSFKKAYGLESLTLDNLDGLIQEMARDKELLQKYYRFKMRDSEPAIVKGCDHHCMRDNLCSIVTTVYDDATKCKELLKYRFADIME